MNTTTTNATSDLLALVAPVLTASPFAHPSRWASAVVILRTEGRRVTSRGDFAHWLAANDLRGAANECITRRVPRGHVLVWIEADVAEAAGAGFVVFDLARAAHKARAAA